MAKTVKQKDINLLLALEKGGTSSAEAQRRRKIIIFLAAIVLIVAILAGWFFLEYMKLNNQKVEALSYIEDPIVLSSYADASQLQDEATAAEERANWLQALLTAIDGYPLMNADKFSQVYGYAGGRIDIVGIEYDNPTGVLTFDASSDSATGVPIFVAQLRMSGIFEDVTYEGYKNSTDSFITGTTVNPDGTIVDDVTTREKYVFIVSCLVKAGE